MAISALSLRALDDDEYVVEMSTDAGYLAARVPVPSIYDGKTLDTSERDKRAGLAAQQLAMMFLEATHDNLARHNGKSN